MGDDGSAGDYVDMRFLARLFAKPREAKGLLVVDGVEPSMVGRLREVLGTPTDIIERPGADEFHYSVTRGEALIATQRLSAVDESGIGWGFKGWFLAGERSDRWSCEGFGVRWSPIYDGENP